MPDGSIPALHDNTKPASTVPAEQTAKPTDAPAAAETAGFEAALAQAAGPPAAEKPDTPPAGDPRLKDDFYYDGTGRAAPPTSPPQFRVDLPGGESVYVWPDRSIETYAPGTEPDQLPAGYRDVPRVPTEGPVEYGTYGWTRFEAGGDRYHYIHPRAVIDEASVVLEETRTALGGHPDARANRTADLVAEMAAQGTPVPDAVRRELESLEHDAETRYWIVSQLQISALEFAARGEAPPNVDRLQAQIDDVRAANDALSRRLAEVQESLTPPPTVDLPAYRYDETRVRRDGGDVVRTYSPTSSPVEVGSVLADEPAGAGRPVDAEQLAGDLDVMLSRGGQFIDGLNGDLEALPGNPVSRTLDFILEGDVDPEIDIAYNIARSEQAYAFLEEARAFIDTDAFDRLSDDARRDFLWDVNRATGDVTTYARLAISGMADQGGDVARYDAGAWTTAAVGADITRRLSIATGAVLTGQTYGVPAAIGLGTGGSLLTRGTADLATFAPGNEAVTPADIHQFAGNPLVEALTTGLSSGVAVSGPFATFSRNHPFVAGAGFDAAGSMIYDFTNFAFTGDLPPPEQLLLNAGTEVVGGAVLDRTFGPLIDGLLLRPPGTGDGAAGPGTSGPGTGDPGSGLALLSGDGAGNGGTPPRSPAAAAPGDADDPLFGQTRPMTDADWADAWRTFDLDSGDISFTPFEPAPPRAGLDPTTITLGPDDVVEITDLPPHLLPPAPPGLPGSPITTAPPTGGDAGDVDLPDIVGIGRPPAGEPAVGVDFGSPGLSPFGTPPPRFDPGTFQAAPTLDPGMPATGGLPDLTPPGAVAPPGRGSGSVVFTDPITGETVTFGPAGGVGQPVSGSGDLIFSTGPDAPLNLANSPEALGASPFAEQVFDPTPGSPISTID